MEEYPERTNRITRFLLDINKLMDGIHIEETTDYELRNIRIKFEAKLISPFAQPGMWSPTPYFYQILEQCCKKHFKDSMYSSLDFNNTNTIFSVSSEKV